MRADLLDNTMCQEQEFVQLSENSQYETQRRYLYLNVLTYEMF